MSARIQVPNAIIFEDWAKMIRTFVPDDAERASVYDYIVQYQLFQKRGYDKAPIMPMGDNAKAVIECIQDKMKRMCINYENKVLQRGRGEIIEGERKRERKIEMERERERNEKEEETREWHASKLKIDNMLKDRFSNYLYCYKNNDTLYLQFEEPTNAEIVQDILNYKDSNEKSLNEIAGTKNVKPIVKKQ